MERGVIVVVALLLLEEEEDDDDDENEVANCQIASILGRRVFFFEVRMGVDGDLVIEVFTAAAAVAAAVAAAAAGEGKM